MPALLAIWRVVAILFIVFTLRLLRSGVHLVVNSRTSLTTTSSISEVKQRWVWSVLGWVTAFLLQLLRRSAKLSNVGSGQ